MITIDRDILGNLNRLMKSPDRPDISIWVDGETGEVFASTRGEMRAHLLGKPQNDWDEPSTD